MKWFAAVLILSTASLADIVVPEPTPAPDVQPPPEMKHPEGIEKVPMGVIQGGWGYVYASYGVGIAGLLMYAASLFLRRPEAKS